MSRTFVDLNISILLLEYYRVITPLNGVVSCSRNFCTLTPNSVLPFVARK